MRVLLISHTCQSATEGQPRAEQLGRLPGIELQVLAPDRWLHYGRWRFCEVPARGSFRLHTEKVCWPWAGPAQCYLHWYPALGRMLRDFRPDIIDLWEEPWGLVSAQACHLRKRLLPTAKVVSETEQNIDKRLPPPFESFRSYTLGQADFVIGRSREAVEIVRGKGYAGPAAVIPNAVDTNLFRPLPREGCRAELAVSGFLVGYIGRLVEEKGLTDLVEALVHCPESVSLLIVGDGPLRPLLEQRVRELRLESRVRLIPGRPLQELPNVMNALDVLALPSRTTARWKEQFGRVIIEAHACGVPVLGSDSGAIPEVVGAGGVIVPEQNPGALARALRELQGDPARARALGEAGRRQVLAGCTWEQVAQRMRSIYLGLTSDEPSVVSSRKGRTEPVR